MPTIPLHIKCACGRRLRISERKFSCPKCRRAYYPDRGMKKLLDGLGELQKNITIKL